MNYLGLNQEKTGAVAEQLNKLLSCYHVYYQNLRNFHWNIEGRHFFDLHEKFESMYDDAKLKIDEIAERILTLRERPVSTLSEYLSISDVKEAKDVHVDSDMVSTLLENHGVLINLMRETLQAAETNNDEGTTDLIGGYLGELEKTSWMLDAWLQKTDKEEPALT